MAKKVSLPNGRTWSKQGDAMQHFKAMLARYNNGDRVADPQDHDDLSALLIPYDGRLPPGANTKIGAGISHFTRQVNTGDRWRSAGFHVHRIDGSSIDFSYIEAVKAASS
ncbi:DCL family protein [Paraburkholderia fungorum]|uniref:DCL family protein n=1 Tax=Paraburkholderia fungorum TaxID=134537 RepID=UPI00248DFA6F|nr:DCL family protein [Paraburkholderia fungorum]